MNTRLLLTASSLALGVVGLSLSFAPEEMFSLMSGGAIGPWAIILQLCGALYCGFALTNWMAKGATLGGIYGRPIVIGNLMHFTIGGLALVKVVSSGSATPAWWILTGVYVVLAALFGYVMFTHPSASATNA